MRPDREMVDTLAVERMRGILMNVEVDPDGGCLEWDGSIDPISGYGRMWVGGTKGRNYPVHRLSICVTDGYDYQEINEWLVRHQCNNRRCYRPSHLLLGDDKQNVLDRVFAGRSGVVKGEANHRAILTDAQVEEIRTLHAAGWKQAALAREFGVSSMHVSRLVNYRQRA